MRRVPCFRLLATVSALLIPALVMTGAAQNSARIHGVVTDADGQPVEGASVTMEFQGGLARQYETMTNDDGEFMQIGLMRGPYSVTASKEEVGALIGTVTLRAGQVFEMNMELLRPGDVIREGLSEEELERIDRAAAATDAFGQGLDATRSGDLGKAITLFNQALGASPDCADCHRNLGIVYGQMKDYGQAETAFKAALALKPDDPASYDGLAGIYNAQQRFDDAAEASAAAAKLSGRDAAGGGDAAAVFDQGLIFWNAGRLDDARQQFERTVELDPDHGEVHYWLGMGNLNGGQIPEAADELRLYLDREPAGRFAEQARGILAQIQP